MRCGLVAMFTSLGLAGCYLAHEADGTEPSVDAGEEDASVDAGVATLVWVLVHPGSANAGLHLVDEERQVVVRRLQTPDISPSEALAWDGESLWVAGYVRPGRAVMQVDPLDGREISRWPDVRTEGIAFDGATFWYGPLAAYDPVTTVRQVDRRGSVLASFTVEDGRSVQDIVSANGALFYLVNESMFRRDLQTGATVELVRGLDPYPYSLGFDGRHLAIAGRGRILRFDVDTGALVRDDPFAVPGSINAIAFVR
jgi:hypothetical protein